MRICTPTFLALVAVFACLTTRLPATPGQGARLVLKDGGEYYVNLLESRSEKGVRIEASGQVYVVPRSEIEELVPGAEAPIQTTLVLADGSSITGQVVRETSEAITMKTGAGFQVIRRRAVAEKEHAAPATRPLPARYLEDPEGWYSPATSAIGILLGGAAIAPPAGQAVAAAGGLSVFYDHGDRVWIFSPGIQLEGFVGSGRSPDLFGLNRPAQFLEANLFFYHQWQYRAGPLLDFYLRLGPGVSYHNFSGETGESAGVNPAALLSGGWQGFGTERFRFRFGLRVLGVATRDGGYSSAGLEIGGVYRF